MIFISYLWRADDKQTSWITALWWLSVSLWRICITFVWPSKTFCINKTTQRQLMQKNWWNWDCLRDAVRAQARLGRLDSGSRQSGRFCRNEKKWKVKNRIRIEILCWNSKLWRYKTLLDNVGNFIKQTW